MQPLAVVAHSGSFNDVRGNRQCRAAELGRQLVSLVSRKSLSRNLMQAHEQVVRTPSHYQRFVFRLFGHAEGVGKTCSLAERTDAALARTK